jgi:putative flippase GtrA
MTAGRALAVGFACALLHNAIMISGDWMGWHYAASLVVSFAIVVGVAYWLHSGWTFGGAVRSGGSFARYVVVASANFPLSLAGMYVLVDLAGLPVALAAPLLTVLLAVLNFFGSRWALRARRTAPGRT